jgi:hypothetical protein
LLILTDSDVIDTTQRFRQYSGTAGVSADSGTTAPEYLSALEFFGQTPQPAICYVGRWARTATHGTLQGGVLSAAQQAIGNFNAIANGGISITVDGVVKNLSAISLIGLTNLNGIAAAIQTAFSGAATVVWDANNARFTVKSSTTGSGSTVSFASVGSGTDLSILMGLNASVSGVYSVVGIAAETALAAVQALLNATTAWYGLVFASSVAPSDADYTAVSAAIQAASPSRIFAVSTAEAAALVGGTGTSIANSLIANRTFVQYCSSSAHAAAAAMGIAFTTNFDGAQTLYTLKFKQESGITPETLTESQAAALMTAFCNVFVNYNNGVAILQNGTMTDGSYFDVIHGTDWLQNAIQTAIFNLLLTNRKIPQTDAGVNQIVTTICNILEQAVTNGLIAPGVWNGPPIGAIVTGQSLSKGYYVYAPPVATQSQAARASRQSPVITICIKLAGAIHTVNFIINVNA